MLSLRNPYGISKVKNLTSTNKDNSRNSEKLIRNNEDNTFSRRLEVIKKEKIR